jgi:hypothetical protein
LTLIERLYKNLQSAKVDNNVELIAELEKAIRKREREFSAISIDYLTMKPGYFNSGCCCFVDGDITGIEIADATIRLIKWTTKDESPKREILEEIKLEELARNL